MPDSLVSALAPASPALDLDEVARAVAEGLAPDATILDALDDAGYPALLVPRHVAPALGALALATRCTDANGERCTLVEVLPSSPASMAELERRVRMLLVDLELERRGVRLDGRTGPVLLRDGAARVLALRGPLLVDGADRWHELVDAAVEIGRLLVENRRARAAALEAA